MVVPGYHCNVMNYEVSPQVQNSAEFLLSLCSTIDCLFFSSLEQLVPVCTPFCCVGADVVCVERSTVCLISVYNVCMYVVKLTCIV